MKLLRTIQFDASDTFIFEKSAEPGEWAVPGAFVFWNADPAAFEGKARSAFRGGFLGVASFGWSTLAQIVVVNDDQRRAAVDVLARQLMVKFGAPNIADATAAAQEEFAFAASLCVHPPDTLIAMHRTAETDGIHEAFRTLQPRNGAKPLRAFSFLDIEGDEDDSPAECVDLIGMTQRKMVERGRE